MMFSTLGELIVIPQMGHFESSRRSEKDGKGEKGRGKEKKERGGRNERKT